MKIRANRKSTDLLLIFAAGFGLVGGLVVFSSYALSRPVVLTPGVYSQQSLMQDHGSKLTLQVDPEKVYCFVDSAIPSSVSTQLQSRTSSSPQESCYSAEKRTDLDILLYDMDASFKIIVK